MGWGSPSLRHWDAWLSGKPMLTDRYSDGIEMIPGLRLKEGVHYLVFDGPEEIPDIVSDWTRPSRIEELEEIGKQGLAATTQCNPLARMIEFFDSIQGRDHRKSSIPASEVSS